MADLEGQKKWWDYLDNHWNDVLSFVSRYIDLSKPAGLELPKIGKMIDISGQWAIKYADKDFIGMTIADQLESLKNNKDPRIALIFHAAWAACPDSINIHAMSGWSHMTNLIDSEDCFRED